MSNEVRVAVPPPKPLMVFDGDCGFCRRWIARWQRATGDEVDYAPYQDAGIAARFPEILHTDFEHAVHLIQTDGSVCDGAEAVFRSLAAGGRERSLLWCYKHIPPFRNLTEILYEEVAKHREFISKIDRFFLGANPAPREYALVRFVFLRGLGVIYLIAFLSLAVQIQGLIGSNGISPAASLTKFVKQTVDAQHIGMDRYRLFPTLAWWNAGDTALNIQCAAGVGLSGLLILGIAPAPVLFLLWAVYLSLSTIGAPFLNFQWDTLLLETGFLAIFFAPLQWRERPLRQPGPSHLALWLLRWLAFRLMFESGVVKLASGDDSWRHLTALRVHFETQPLPTWIGWYAHQLPAGVLSVCALVMFVIELAGPFLILCGRKPRHIAAAAFVSLQIAILLTGNYTFFNGLTILLCVPLLDDETMGRFLPRRRPQPASLPVTGARWPWKLTVPLAVVVFLLTATGLPLAGRFAQKWPRPLVAMYAWLDPLRSFNSYGLFANMTQTRDEIIIEGSEDGQSWREYEFNYKPGDVSRRPGFVAPHQPRLDWQMWFAALGTPQQNQWFLRLEYQLLKNSQPVVALFEKNPFPDKPPKFIRATLYEYHFTDFATRRATGNWWRRELKGEYTPALSLENFETREPENAGRE